MFEFDFQLKMCLLSLYLKSITLCGPDFILFFLFFKALQRVMEEVEKQSCSEVKSSLLFRAWVGMAGAPEQLQMDRVFW